MVFQEDLQTATYIPPLKLGKLPAESGPGKTQHEHNYLTEIHENETAWQMERGYFLPNFNLVRLF